MTLSAAERLDALNIGLMLLACVVAVIIPLELFLFSYAILGPLHYLTEISWLHDRNYFTKGRYDAIALIIIGLVTSMAYYSMMGYMELEFPENYSVQQFLMSLGYIALLSAAVFALVKNTFYRIAGIVLIIITSQLSEHFALFLGVFLPTLIHVYVFTGLFMLYGALKSKSRLGIASVIMLLLCPALLFFAFPDFKPMGLTEAAQQQYIGDHGSGFIALHMTALREWFGIQPATDVNPARFWLEQVFHSRTGILLMRFIAFAYTYHYLNWFSKTRIIQWHKVPKWRFGVVILFWIVSVALYLYDYIVGFMWLFFLSYLHVVLEFPLNYTSIVGIGKFFRQRLFRSTASA
jgi:hypothetical protein